MLAVRTTLFACALVALAACATDGQQSSGAAPDADAPEVSAPEASAPDAGALVAARVDGEAISVDQLDEWIKQDLFRRELSGGGSDAKLYDLRRGALERMISERLVEREARSRGMNPDALLAAEVESLGPVSDQEVNDFYEDNKTRIEGGGTLEELSPRIRAHLERQRPGEVIEQIRDAATVEIELERPRMKVAGRGPSRGPADAAVVIIEFSDYQCPFCRRAEPTLNEIIARYPNDVRWEYRHFPLANHPLAKPAAEAAVCAEAQGKFWPYHDKLFAQTGKLDTAGLRQYAAEVELDLSQFDTCLQAPETRARVEADQQAGQRAGARGTPAFFLNGIFMNGAQPIEEFEKLIQAELRQTAAAAPADAR